MQICTSTRLYIAPALSVLIYKPLKGPLGISLLGSLGGSGSEVARLRHDFANEYQA